MSEQQVAAFKEVINTIGELLISLIVLIGGGLVMLNPASGPDLRLLAGSSMTLVLGVWFTNRTAYKAQNGTLTAMSQLASRQADQLAASQQNTANIVSSAISQNQANGGSK